MLITCLMLVNIKSNRFFIPHEKNFPLNELLAVYPSLFFKSYFNCYEPFVFYVICILNLNHSAVFLFLSLYFLPHIVLLLSTYKQW